MAVNFSESMTKENLMRAFAGESQARNRYTIAAERAEKEGMLTIAEIFRYTADQERAHAERFYDLLKDLSGETIHIDGSYPVDQQDSLTGLLRAAEHNEHEEFADVYQTFGKTAKEEGFSDLQNLRKCSNPAAGISRRVSQNGCAQTAAIYTKGIRRLRCALCAGMTRGTSYHTRWPATKSTDSYYV